MQMVKTINRYPAWWTLYYALRFIYFISIPVLSIFILFGVLSITSSRYVTQEDYIYTCVCLFLLIAPAILMYSRASSRKDKIKIVAEIKTPVFIHLTKNMRDCLLLRASILAWIPKRHYAVCSCLPWKYNGYYRL